VHRKEIGCAQRVLSLHAANYVVAERVLAEALNVTVNNVDVLRLRLFG
jgi:hypothetical protein